MAIVSKNYTYATGAVIVAAEQNANLDTLYNLVNGNIDNANISGSAAIAYAKLALTNGIMNSDINTSAAIVDTKLAQITTASKVSGTAITGLASVPSGAGVLPIANIATGTPTGSKYVRDDGTLQTITVAPVTSNVLFQYSAICDVTLGTGVGEFVGSSLVPTTGGTYRFIESKNASGNFTLVWKTKFIKTSGISTVTIYGQIWQASAASATLKVDIGGVNNNVTGTSSQTTPEWKTFTIDVSSLSNGTTYDVSVYNGSSGGGTISSYLGTLIAFGS